MGQEIRGRRLQEKLDLKFFSLENARMRMIKNKTKKKTRIDLPVSVIAEI